MSKAKVSFLVCDSLTNTSKSYSLKNKKIEKKASAQMYEASATLMQCSLNKVAQIIDDALSNRVLIYGLPEMDYLDDDNQVTISTPNRKKISTEDSIIHRSKLCLKYRKTPSIMMCDYDPSPYGPKMTATSVIEAINKIVDLTNVGYIVSHSVSSQVHIDVSPKKHGGRHILIGVKDGRLIRTEKGSGKSFRIVHNKGQTLFDRLYLNGHGYIALSSCGSYLVRTCIDASVFSGERIDFVGAPISVGEGLVYKKVKAQVHEGELLDLNLIEDLSDSERKQLNKMIDRDKLAMSSRSKKIKEIWMNNYEQSLIKKGLSKEEAKKSTQLLAASGFKVLPPEFELTFNQLGVVTVADVMKDPTKYHGQELADPIEGPSYGNTTAKYYYNDKSGHCIASFAHGSQRYSFKQNMKAKDFITYKDRIVNHIDNIRTVLNAKGIVCRRNLMTHENEFETDQSFIDEGRRNAELIYLKGLCAGEGVPTSDFLSQINAICTANAYHPIRDYIEGLEWDGKNHLRLLFKTITLKYPNDEAIYWLMFKRWFIQCIAALYDPEYAANGVLLFISGEGLGKTWWIKRLCDIKHSVGTDISVDTHNKDDIALYSSYWIVELGEIDATFKKSDVSALKQFISRTHDEIRPPYGIASEKLKRMTSPAGSVNGEQPLDNENQNRRYWPLPLTAIDSYHTVSMDQVWAQCKKMYDDGESWQFKGKELDLLKEHNRKFRREDTVSGLLEHAGIVDPRSYEGKIVCQDLNVTGILHSVGNYCPSGKELSQCTQYLKEHGYKYSARDKRWLVGFTTQN